MIRKIKLLNFQSHEKTELEFGPGVNVIVGPSDSGKTAILRALNWILTNRPLGESFRSHWGGETLAEVFFDAQNTISRYRHKTTNEYQCHIKGKGMVFKAVKADVPKEVADCLNLNEVNVQSQHDKPFLLSESPGEVARILNKAVNLDGIDKAMSRINSKQRETASALKYSEQQLEQKEEKIALFKELDELDGGLSALEKMEKHCRRMSIESSNIYQIAEILESTQKTIKRISPISKISYAEVEKKVARLTAAKKERETLERLSGKLSSCGSWMESWTQIIQLEGEVKKIQEKETKSGIIKADILSLSNLVSSLRAIKTSSGARTQELERAEKMFEELMPEKCPLCGRSCDCEGGRP